MFISKFRFIPVIL